MARIEKTLTIPSGDDTSEVLEMVPNGPAMAFIAFAPAVLAEVVNPEVAPHTAGGFRTLESNGVDIAFRAGKATPIVVLAGCALQLKSTTNVAADRVFVVVGSEYK